ncbi:12083_t:CDS:1, partial [Funneliformis mosseae]
SILTIFDKSTPKTQNFSDQQIQQNPPSLFLVKTVLRLGKINITKLVNKHYNFTSETSTVTGEVLGTAIIKSKNEVYENKQRLENPNSFKHYRQSFSSILVKFFDGFIITLEKKKLDILNKKRKQRNLEIKPLDKLLAEKKSAFLISIILTIAFP